MTQLLARSGAVPADGADESVASHYGDPFREQRTLVEAAGLVDRGNRGVITVTGPDRLSWLHSLTSQHVSALPPMTGTEALILSPHGHVEHHMLLADDGTTTWIDVEPGTASELTAYLDRMRFMLRVEVADVSADWAVLSIVGPATDDALRRLPVYLAPGPYAVGALPGGGLVRRMPWPAPGGADLLVPRDRVADLPARLVVPMAGIWAYEALRVRDRRPRLRHETDHRTIPHEIGWLGVAVHLDKGCYRGQETVARVHNLGRPPRRLVLLHLDGSGDVLPATGDDVLSHGARVGFVTTAVRHHEDGPIALALVKRSTPDDAELTAGGVPAAIDQPDQPA